MKILSLFSGIGAFEKALKNLGVKLEIVGTSEVDKEATVSYAAIYNGLTDEIIDNHDFPSPTEMADYLKEKRIDYDFEKDKPYNWDRLARRKNKKLIKKYYLASVLSKNYGDITTMDLDDLPKCDMITHGSPCQDFSVAGLGGGGGVGSGTRSSLMWNSVEIIRRCKPKFVVWENVKGVLSKRHKHNFDLYLQTLDDIGYSNYYEVLNAKDYGIPQNRERVFVISIRKDIDKGLVFPKPFDNGLRLKDVLEDEVDEKFYISQEKTEKLISQIKLNNPSIKREPGKADGVYTNQSLSFTRPPLKDLNRTLKANVHDAAVVMPIGINVSKQGAVLDKETDIASTLLARDYKGLGNQSMTAVCIPCITPDREEKRQNGRRFKEDGDPMFTITGQDRHGVLQVGKGVAQTLETSCNQAVIDVKPRKDIKELEKHCEYCGEKLERKRFNGRLEDFGVFNNRKYCDRECMRKAFVMVGENEQSWSTAHATARKINELFLQKDSCEICGSTQNLDIHHVDGNWQNNELNNLMCLCRSCHTKYEKNKDKECGYRIRKLTPKETWRLMGFTDEEFQKAQDAGVSNSQLYKQAGNSIVVNVLEAIFANLKETYGLEEV